MKIPEMILSGNVYAVAILVIFAAMNILWGEKYMGILSVISAVAFISADLSTGNINVILSMVGWLLLLSATILQSIYICGWFKSNESDKSDKK